MHIVLVSEDPELRRLCSDVLNEFPGLDWQLTAATPADCRPDADLYIWDHAKTTPSPHVDQTRSRHLFVIHRDEISRYYDSAGEISSGVLLKPVTRACLSVFLELAAQERISSTNALRADRDEILQCLIQSSLRIQQYDQDRSNFLARAVHDFRAPLMTANGYCGLLLSEALGPQNEEQKEVLRRMQHSIKRLSRMASAMFELSIGKQIKREPELRRADIRECVDQALHEITPLADGKRISMDVDLDAAPPLLIQPDQIEQVLINILENACKFTPKGGDIRISGYPYFWDRRKNSAAVEPERRLWASRQPNSYRVDIWGSGSPIPPEHIGKIFEEYTSYSGGSDRSGGGLGLAICKMILNAHRGYVWAENSPSGPVFCFVLPLGAAEPVTMLDGNLMGRMPAAHY